MTGATLYPPVLRTTPQLGPVELLVHAVEVAIIACVPHTPASSETRRGRLTR